MTTMLSMASSVRSNQFARQILSPVLCFAKKEGRFKTVVVVLRLLSLGKSSWGVDTEWRILFSHHLPMLQTYHIGEVSALSICRSPVKFGWLQTAEKKLVFFEENQI